MATAAVGHPQTVPAIRQEVRAGKYLSFQLGTEEFAIQVLKVREIMGIQHITAVPHMAADVRGVINLRGRVIPVIDLRLKFGLEEKEYGQRTCIIVVQLQKDSTVQMGIIVDEVSEVLNLAATDIQNTPNFGSEAAPPYLLGMANVKGKVKILLDIDEILTGSDLGGIADLLQRTPALN
jgi:purine-binding chemotaxis protein CheW